MKPDIRRAKLVELVKEQGRVSVDELAEKLETSRETIRRDLSLLASEGLIRKVHGSALLPETGRESAFDVRMHEAAPEKKRVAAHAASLFKPGDTLFVDTGTTTLAFAHALAEMTDLTVITNSFAIATAISRGSGRNKVFVLGGEYRDDAGENVGLLTIEQISRFNASHAVITVGAISTRGVMDYSLEEVEVARAMVERARSLTVIADASKFGREALFDLCRLDAIDRLVVSEAPGRELAKALSDAKVEVIVAQ